MQKEDVVSFETLRHDEDGRMLLDGTYFTGIAVDYWSDGSKGSEISFRDGLQDGLSIGWYPTGAKSSEKNYVAGRACGLWREWYPNGRLKREVMIDERGDLSRGQEWSEAGELMKSW